MASTIGVRKGGDKWKMLAAAVIGLLVVIAVGQVSYQQGISAGKADANQARQQALASRGLSATGQAQSTANGQGQGTFSGNGQGTSGSGGGFGGFGGRPAVTGTVQKVDGNTVTVTQSDGTQATVVLSDTTRITVTSQGSASDLKQGQTITVSGAKGSDGNYAATSVTVVPAGMLQQRQQQTQGQQTQGQQRQQQTPQPQQTPQSQ